MRMPVMHAMRSRVCMRDQTNSQTCAYRDQTFSTRVFRRIEDLARVLGRVAILPTQRHHIFKGWPD
jgi:hypothetical protein